jgi:hypothetical protein
MTAVRSLLAAAALMGAAAAASASAAPLTVIGTGESFVAQYDETYTGNIVGGGVIASETRGKDNRVVYVQPNQSRSAGIPVQRGGSEGDVAYLPQVSPAARMAAR